MKWNKLNYPVNNLEFLTFVCCEKIFTVVIIFFSYFLWTSNLILNIQKGSTVENFIYIIKISSHVFLSEFFNVNNLVWVFFSSLSKWIIWCFGFPESLLFYAQFRWIPHKLIYDFVGKICFKSSFFYLIGWIGKSEKWETVRKSNFYVFFTLRTNISETFF